MITCEEMKMLRKWLADNNIEWIDKSTDDMFYICRTHFYINDWFVSVVNGYGTYGGIAFDGLKNRGLLEMMCDMFNGGEPIGYLNADDVIGYLEQLKAGE